MCLPEPEVQRRRVVLLTRDGFYSRLFLRAFLNDVQHDMSVEVVGLVLSTARLNRGQVGLTSLWSFVRRVGLGYAVYQAYVCWILPWLKRLKAFDQLPVRATDDVNTLEAIAWVNALKPDFLLSFHFNQKLLQPLIDIPNQAALNFHPSYLPAWRGVDPVLFALQEPGAALGGTLHRVTVDIDAGDVLLREKLGNEHVAGLIATNSRLFTLGGRMSAAVLADFVVYDQQRLVQQDLGTGRYDGWKAVGQLGCAGLVKALWGQRR